MRWGRLERNGGKGLEMMIRPRRDAPFLLLALLPAMMTLWNGPIPPDLRRDIDIVIGGQGILVASGLTPDFYHYGYFHFLLLGWWYGLLHALGALPFAGLQHLSRPAIDPAALRQVLGAAVLFQAVQAGAAVLFFLGIARRLAGSAAAWAGTLLFAASMGMLALASFIQSELTAGLALVAALYFLLRARDADSDGSAWGFIAAASAAAFLAVMSKGQAFMVAMAFTVVIVAVGRPVPRPRPADSAGRTAVFALLAAMAALPAWFMMVGTWLNGGRGLYQPAIALLTLAAVVAYARLYRAEAWRKAALGAAAAVVLGLALGQYVHLVRFDGHYTDATVNVLDHLMNYRTGMTAGDAGPPLPQVLAGNLVTVFQDKATNFGMSNKAGASVVVLYPLRLLYLAVPLALAVLVRRRNWAGAVRVAVLFGLALCSEAAMMARYASLFHWPAYFIFVEAWLIAAALVAVRETGLDAAGPRAGRVVLAAAVAMAVVQTAEMPGWTRFWRAHQSVEAPLVCQQLRNFNPRLAPYLPSCRG